MHTHTHTHWSVYTHWSVFNSADMSCEHETYLVITGHSLWLPDMSCEHETCPVMIWMSPHDKTCFVIRRQVLWTWTMFRDHKTYLVITRHVLWTSSMSRDHKTYLWLQDMSCEHETCPVIIGREHETCPVIIGHILWLQDMSCEHETCFVIVRHISWLQDVSCEHETCFVIIRHVSCIQDMSCEHETCFFIIRHVSWLHDKRRLKGMYSPCQLRIQHSFLPTKEKADHTSTRLSDVNRVFFFHTHTHTHTHAHTHWSDLRQLRILPFSMPKKERSNTCIRRSACCQLCIFFPYTHTHSHTNTLKRAMSTDNTALPHTEKGKTLSTENTAFVHTERGKNDHTFWLERLKDWTRILPRAFDANGVLISIYTHTHSNAFWAKTFFRRESFGPDRKIACA